MAWHISSGEVNFQTVRKNMPDSSTEISTPTARATTGELSEGSINVDQEGAATCASIAGSPTCRPRPGEKVQVGASEALKVDEIGKAAPKVTLPAVPALLAPPAPDRGQLREPRPGHHAARVEIRCPGPPPTT